MSFPAGADWTLDDILADTEKHDSLIDLSRNRFRQATAYVQPYFSTFVRCNKIYRNIVDATADADEPNTGPAYAYGIIEDLVSKIAEPILQLRPPCRVQAKRAGQEKSAANFSTIAANYFRQSRFQMDFTTSIREMCITGNAWEADEWANEYIVGRKWQRVRRTRFMDQLRNVLGRVVELAEPEPVEYESIEEVAAQYPERVGYHTRFPDVFNIFPEPGPVKDRDLHWLIEQVPADSLENMERRMYQDPQTGERIPLFDFSQVYADIGEHRPGQLQPMHSAEGGDLGKEIREAIAGQLAEDVQPELSDIDKMYFQWHFEKTRFWVVANDTWVVAYRANMNHAPRIPYRLKIYTPQKGFLYGTGAIEPIESNFYELGDIHKLSMQNWVRIINKMVAYNEDAVPFLDDFKPRAGGKIRVRTSTSVAHEIMSLEQTDVTQSMLLQEANTKGLIERAIAVADFSPGPEGTKQTHKTLGGLMEIARNVAQRTTTIRRMILAGFQDQMWYMEKLFSQFQFDKVPFQIYGPDGGTLLSEFNMWDIYTDGVGFDYVIEYDPSFGDDALLRNQMMVLLDQALKYEQARISLGMTEAARVNIEDIMRRIFKAFGWADTSNILRKQDGQLDPDQEFELMLQGIPTEPHANENLALHLVDHTIQINSPKYNKGREEEIIDDRTHLLMKAHLHATTQKLAALLADPRRAAEDKMGQLRRKEIMAGRGQPENVSPTTASIFPDGVPFARPEIATVNQGAANQEAPFV